MKSIGFLIILYLNTKNINIIKIKIIIKYFLFLKMIYKKVFILLKQYLKMIYYKKKLIYKIYKIQIEI